MTMKVWWCHPFPFRLCRSIYYYSVVVLLVHMLLLMLTPGCFGGVPRMHLNDLHCECGISNKDDDGPNFAMEAGDNEDAEDEDGDVGASWDMDSSLTRLYSQDHAWPWMVAIVNMTEVPEPLAYCGGTIINNKYILTAAHCIPDMRDIGFDKFKVHIGTNTIRHPDFDDDLFVEADISEIISHEMFNFDTADFDIALIKLKQTLEFSKTIRPICLPDLMSGVPPEVGVITGWGASNLSLPTENRLKETAVQFVSEEECTTDYSGQDIPITKNMLCARVLPEVMNNKPVLLAGDPCKGDSGGPLIVQGNDHLGPGRPGSRTSSKFYQLGIISHGKACSYGLPGELPPIFTRVTNFVEWILTHTQDAHYC